MAKKQPAAPAQTVPPLRRSLAAPGPSSLRRSSAHTVSCMAMRRSDVLVDTTPKLIVDLARNFTVGGTFNDALRPTIETQRRKAGERADALTLSIVDRRSRNLFGRSIGSVGRDVQETNLSNFAAILFHVNVRSKSFAKRKTLSDNHQFRLKGLEKYRLTIVDCSSKNLPDKIAFSVGVCTANIGETAVSSANLKLHISESAQQSFFERQPQDTGSIDSFRRH